MKKSRQFMNRPYIKLIADKGKFIYGSPRERRSSLILLFHVKNLSIPKIIF